ncbi:MAG TPA: sulfite exporter TauE/SafE family protein [Eoetvoesiella sp.]
MALTSIAFGSAIGMVLGLTGAGGGILAVPALVLGIGLGMAQAMPVALMAVGGAALLGALDGLRKGLVRYKAAFLMALSGSVVSPLGMWIAHRVSAVWLMTLFSLVMLIVAARMLQQACRKSRLQDSTTVQHKHCMINPATGKLQWHWKSSFVLAAVGAVSGLFTGMLGVGGGFLIVPALKHFSNISMHGIVATSLMVIALISTSSVAGALAAGAQVPIAGWYFIAAAAGGMLAGRLLAPFLRERWLQIGFALITTLVSLLLLSRAYF